MQSLETNQQEHSQSTSNPQFADLVNEINESHAKCQDAVSDAVHYAARAGKSLLKAKESLPHGRWLPWLKQNCTCSLRHAQRYMQIAKAHPDLANATRATHLSLREVLKLLADYKDRENAKGFDKKQVTDSKSLTNSPKGDSDEHATNATDGEHVDNPRPTIYVPTENETENEGDKTFVPTFSRATAAGRGTDSPFMKPKLDAYLTFADGSPETKAMKQLVDEVRAAVSRYAMELVTDATTTAEFDESTVTRVLLTRLVEQLTESLRN